MKILVIHGPNLNFLGIREPETYGHFTLDDVNKKIIDRCNELEVEVEIFQSSHEGMIIDKIHENYKKADYLVINPGAFTHYSIAIRDAILAIQIPTVEVHLSNVHAREDFRKHSVISDIAIGQICGLGYRGYLFALDYIKEAAINV